MVVLDKLNEQIHGPCACKGMRPQAVKPPRGWPRTTRDSTHEGDVTATRIHTQFAVTLDIVLLTHKTHHASVHILLSSTHNGLPIGASMAEHAAARLRRGGWGRRPPTRPCTCIHTCILMGRTQANSDWQP